MLLKGSDCPGHAASAPGMWQEGAVWRPRAQTPAHPPPGHSVTVPQQKHVLVPQKWASKFLLSLYMEENPTGFARKVFQCCRRRFWDAAVESGTGQWVTGEHSEELPVPHHSFQWGLGAARLAGLGPPTSSPWPGATFPSLCGLWLGIGEPSSSQTTIATFAGSSGHSEYAGNNHDEAMPPLARATGPYKDTQGARAALSPAQEGNMKSLIVLTLLALLTFGLCHRAADGSTSTDDLPSSEAFVSRRASAEVVQRQKRNYGYDSVYGVPRDPLEAKREVCELNPDCDELADQIGFQEAYRRYYGLV